MKVRNGWRAAVLGIAAAGVITVGSAQTAGSGPASKALTFNGDGAQRSRDIHWPDDFHPEQADLFAHNEIVVHAPCEKVFANLVDAPVWPSWYPNSHTVLLLNSPDGRLHDISIQDRLLDFCFSVTGVRLPS